jgi:hypothetical protein
LIVVSARAGEHRGAINRPEHRGERGSRSVSAVSEIPASDELLDLIFAALDHGVGSVAEGGPLVPFALTETEDGRELARFVAETLEEGQEQSRRHVRAASDARRAAIAYDGYLTVEEERSDAIFIEAQDRGQGNAVVFAQRYRPGGRLRKFSPIGNAAFVGVGDPLF